MSKTEKSSRVWIVSLFSCPALYLAILSVARVMVIHVFLLLAFFICKACIFKKLPGAPRTSSYTCQTVQLRGILTEGRINRIKRWARVCGFSCLTQSMALRHPLMVFTYILCTMYQYKLWHYQSQIDVFVVTSGMPSYMLLMQHC